MAPLSHSGQPRRLLARVRDVMAGHRSGQEQLDEITAIIASDLVAEVCSIYVLRAGEVLELFATQGLKASAVHRTRLRVGEGLVGQIAAHARPLNLSDAQGHPNFAFRPETGEEVYHSFMGVPILRGGRVIGVLAVQNKTRRLYIDEELETLQTVAMVVAELVASGRLVNRDEQRPADGIALLPLRLEGVRFSAGLGMGQAVLHQPQFVIRSLVAEDPAEEHERLRRAVADMHGALDDMLRAQDLSAGGEHRDVLETYRMIAEDAGWLARIDEAITGGLTAEAAVQRVHNDIRARMSQVSDPYLRERVHDLEDLAYRLMGHLAGPDVPQVSSRSGESLPEHMILIARSMGPAELLDYDRTRLRGLVLEEGSATSHVAIVARALDIPVVGHVHNVLDIVEPGDTVIADGQSSQVFVRPGEDVQQAFKASYKARQERRAAYAAVRDLPAETLDGCRVSVNINAGLLFDLQHLDETGADGVGLYRTEVPFMVRSEFPDVASQTQIYAKILEQAAGRPVRFRTLDVGGDKDLPYWSTEREENPAMGWRAIRVSLDRPAMLRHQLRAMIRASAGGTLSVMFPMIAEVPEFLDARRLLDLEMERARDQGTGVPETLNVGAMVEVPALGLQLPYLLPHVNFVSVGSNDLMQFLFASDRGNARLADRYDTLSPLVLEFLRTMVAQCDTAGVPIALCGEMAGNPVDAMALIGVGFRNLSVSAPFVGPVKSMVRSLHLGRLESYMAEMEGSTKHSLRHNLRAFALDHGVII